jgi:hypothetical protein
MDSEHLKIQTWERCETMRQELAGARCDLTIAAGDFRHSLNAKERARYFIRRRPGTAVLTTLAAGLLASQILPALLWRSKRSLLGRFAGELAKGAAGIALPILASMISARLQTRRPPPAATTLTLPPP